MKNTAVNFNLLTKSFLFFVLLLYSISANAYAERYLLEKKKPLIENSLILNQAWVKFPTYTDRVAWDNLLGEQKSLMIKNGDKYLEYQWQVVKAMDYIEFERSGSRAGMSDALNANIGAISALFIAELAEGKGRFTEQIINGVYHSCEMTSWALSAHLVNQRSKRALPDYTEHLIDLVSGDISATFSWIYYFLHKEFDKVDPAISARLKYEIYNKVLNPYMNEDRYWWMAFDAKPGRLVNNWNVWCNANVLLSFALMENDKDKLVKAVSRTMTSVDKFLNYVNNDGACEEGPAYWGHAAGKMFDYLEVLYSLTGGEITLFNEPLVKNMGEYISRSYIGDNWVVNFADASAKMSLDKELIYRYGKAVNSTEMIEFASYLSSIQPKQKTYSTRDAYRTLENMHVYSEIDKAEPKHYIPAYTWYPETEFCYMKKNNWFVAAKGGHNGESHNHNDVGTFILYINNTPIFIDAGVGTYKRQTFGKERYTIWSMRSDHHNLPVINGEVQTYGREYKAYDTKFDTKQMKFSTNIAKTYKDTQAKSWVRSYTLKQGKLEIEDKFILDKAKEANNINFLTSGNVDISKKGIINIKVNNESVNLKYNSADFTPEVTEITLDDVRLTKVWGDKLYKITLKSNKLITNGLYKFVVE